MITLHACIRLFLLLFLVWPKFSFGLPFKAQSTVSPVDFSPLVTAAQVAGCCSIAVALVWSTGLIVSAKIRKGGPKCGD